MHNHKTCNNETYWSQTNFQPKLSFGSVLRCMIKHWHFCWGFTKLWKKVPTFWNKWDFSPFCWGCTRWQNALKSSNCLRHFNPANHLIPIDLNVCVVCVCVCNFPEKKAQELKKISPIHTTYHPWYDIVIRRWECALLDAWMTTRGDVGIGFVLFWVMPCYKLKRLL